ncbi:hypothetical protein [Oceanivirga miroungae]|uniref:Uncharacterized protein n=1 Tax=Oceanivirga miroungae TaxID=1130046 RepID=A0A6I8MDQ3_9FUSO|nr:hypothetical protein [Oceanivirga miroungae]VWL85221.1 hypothetical protein OMES3154_00504 [Oceanivirga miroungae]
MFRYFNYILKKNLPLMVLEQVLLVLQTFYMLNLYRIYTSFMGIHYLLLLILALTTFSLFIIVLSNIFIKDLFTTQGYFIFTLPIKPINIIVSKILLGVSFLIVNSSIPVIIDLVYYRYPININVNNLLSLFVFVSNIFIYMTIGYVFIIIFKILFNSKLLTYILTAICLSIFTYFYTSLIVNFASFENIFSILNIIAISLDICAVVAIYLISKVFDKKFTM